MNAAVPARVLAPFNRRGGALGFLQLFARSIDVLPGSHFSTRLCFHSHVGCVARSRRAPDQVRGSCGINTNSWDVVADWA